MSDKLAITALGPTKEDAIDPHFGRAAFFIVVDRTTGEYEAHANTGREQAHGAGTSSAAKLQEWQVDTVVSGRFGPKAEQALAALGIAMVTVQEGSTVDDVIRSMTS